METPSPKYARQRRYQIRQAEKAKLADAHAAENAALRAALQPFVTALSDWGDEAEQPDSINMWEHPVAMNLELGDFRRASKALQIGGNKQ